MPRLNLYALLGVPPSTIFDASRKFVTGPTFVYRPMILAAFRILVALYTLITLIVSLVWKVRKLGQGRSYLSYFSCLSYIGICAYFTAAGVQTLTYALNCRRQGSAGAGYPLQRWPRFLQALHVILQATVVTLPIVITILYWALLADAGTFSSTFFSWTNVSHHMLNTVFALFEILSSNSPPAPWLTMPICMLILVGYLGVAFITHDTQHFYPYSFLNPHTQHAKLAGYIIAIGLGTIAVFALVRSVVVLRERVAIKLGRVLSPVGVGGGGSQSDEGNWEDEWEEVERPSNVGGPTKRMNGCAEGGGGGGKEAAVMLGEVVV